jgi:hypothetical protein
VNKMIVATGIILICIGSPFLYWGLGINFSGGDWRGAFLLAIGGASAFILGFILIVQDILKKGLITLGVAILSSGLFILSLWGTGRPGLEITSPSALLAIAGVALFTTAGAVLMIIGVASRRGKRDKEPR